MRMLLSLAVLLAIMWVVLRVALAVTSGMLHLLWIAAVILAIMALASKFRAPRTP